MAEKVEFQELPKEDQQKRKYFANLSKSPGVLAAFKLHVKEGMWVDNPGEKQLNWRNVSEHCLVEVARVNYLASRIGLSEQTTKDLQTAAALHDLNKDKEIKLLSTEGSSYATYTKASEEANAVMREAGFNEDIVELANSVGHESLEKTQKILAKPELEDYDKAYLLLHYVDDITRGSDWALSTEKTPDGRKINELDRRMDKNEANARPGGPYEGINEEGKKYFSGETTFQAQRRIGMQVEEKITEMLNKNTGQNIDPKDLPEIIDAGVKERIAGTKLVEKKIELTKKK